MKHRLFAAALACGIVAASPASFAQQSGTMTPGTGATPPAASATKQTAAKSAQTAQKQLTPQQKKMQDCSREAKAKGFKGDQRKQFMSSCLSAD